uniref:Uncharacterized protein n=1 Tax=Spongospora subterranea TaxID=70186 RepID=A0A0H5RGQ1_9EUKA|eukprot:CRZ12737.1 hypothetical protein [Spongospora subterranea]
MDFIKGFTCKHILAVALKLKIWSKSTMATNALPQFPPSACIAEIHVDKDTSRSVQQQRTGLRREARDINLDCLSEAVIKLDLEVSETRPDAILILQKSSEPTACAEMLKIKNLQQMLKFHLDKLLSKQLPALLLKNR